MPIGFLKLRIYRKKFITSVLMVLLTSAVLFFGLSAFFVSGWLSAQRRAASDIFSENEQRVRKAVNQTSSYILQLYSDYKLVEDISALLSSTSETEYLAMRLKNSLASPNQIRYFAGQLRPLLADSAGMITGVTLVSNKGVKAVWYNWASGAMETTYFADAEYFAVEQLRFGNTLLASYSISSPRSISEQLGEIHFWGYGETIAGNVRTDAGICALTTINGGSVTGQNNSDKAYMGQLEAAASMQNTIGSFGNGIFGRVYYTKSASLLHGYQYVAITDMGMLLAQNSTALILLLMAFVLLDAIIIAWILHGIRYDARFLSYILGMISDVERGDFDAAGQLECPNYVRKDEYGMLATAIKTMSHGLDEYIRIEYLMKIKQQQTAMNVLRHQINPHFLYNTLETIRSQALVEKNATTADAIALLGSLYRDVVRGSSIITLQDEFDLLETYLQIMHLRYPNSLSYQMVLEPCMEEIKTLKFWMQPIVENFFSHGFDIASEYNLFIATGYEEEGGWRLELIDNGSGIAIDKIEGVNTTMRMGGDDTGTSIGLRNVYERLAYFYGEGFTMEIRNNLEGGTTVSLHLPKELPERKEVEA